MASVIVATGHVMDILKADDNRILRGLMEDVEPRGELEILTIGTGIPGIHCLRCRSGNGTWVPTDLTEEQMRLVWKAN